MVQFSTRMDLLKGSEIRELLKLTAQPDIISFAGGMPAPELFPVEQMMEASRAVLEENGRAALQYSSTEGHPRLRQQIAERMLAKNNIHTDADHILVTSGSQQGLDFSARVFLNPGDVVVIPAGVKHWHGAKKDCWFSHIAVEVPGEETRNEWLEAVSDEEYGKL